MNLNIAETLESLSRDIGRLRSVPEPQRIQLILRSIAQYILYPDEGLSLYTEVDLDIKLYQARSEDLETIKELKIQLEEQRKKSSLLQSRSDHFENQSSDYLKCLKKYQSEISSLTLTVHKHQRNSESTSAENARLNHEIEELKAVNCSMADSISADRRTSTIENATLQSQVTSLEKSMKDYKAAFVSTKKKLQLSQRRHLDLLGMSESQSPMGQELDTSSMVWGQEGLEAEQPLGSLLSMDGITRSVPVLTFHTPAIVTSSSLIFDNLDLSDDACLL